MIKTSTILAVTLSLGILPLAASPIVTYTPIQDLTSATALDGNISNTDLIELGNPAVASVTDTVAPYSNNLDAIRDGAGSSDYGDGNVTYYGDLPVTFTVNFNSPEAITEIDSIAGWNNDDVGSQNLTVAYELSGQTSFTTLGTYDNELPVSNGIYDGVGATETLLSISGLSNVTALSFTYGGNETYGMVLHEIDVNAPGAVLVPEPSTWALLTVAVFALGLTRRRLTSPKV